MRFWVFVKMGYVPKMAVLIRKIVRNHENRRCPIISRWTRIFDKLHEQAAMVNVQSHVERYSLSGVRIHYVFWCYLNLNVQ